VASCSRGRDQLAALLLRSHVANGSGQVGRRTFLHPTVPLLAFYAEPVEAFYGAPQSSPATTSPIAAKRVGYFLETAPIHPMLARWLSPARHGSPPAAERLAYAQATIALLIDGHHEDEGGRVTVDRDGRVRVS